MQCVSLIVQGIIIIPKRFNWTQPQRSVQQDFEIVEELTAADSEADEKLLQNHLPRTIKRMFSDARNGISNGQSPILDLLQNIEKELKTKSVNTDHSDATKTLALFWEPCENCYLIEVSQLDDQRFRI